MGVLGIDYGSKTIGLAHYKSDLPLPIGNINNDGDLRFNLMGIIAQYNIKTIVIGWPKNKKTQDSILKFISTLQYMFDGNVIKIDENYTSVQAQAITKSTGKHIAHDTIAAMEIINRYISTLQ